MAVAAGLVEKLGLKERPSRQAPKVRRGSECSPPLLFGTCALRDRSRQSLAAPLRCELWASQIALERALGLTSQHGRALSASDALGGTLAFAAGRVVVMYDAKKNTQRFVHATGPVSSVCFSADGTLIAAGQVSQLEAATCKA